jgi:hypothetical protein
VTAMRPLMALLIALMLVGFVVLLAVLFALR